MMDRFADVPVPSYGLFQPVRVVSELESGITDDRGFITGFLLNPADLDAQGWFYQVLFVEMPSHPWLPLPYADLVHESEIRLMSEEVKE